MNSRIAAIWLGTVGWAMVACGSGDPARVENDENDEVGQVQLTLTAVPTGLSCIQVVVHSAPYGWVDGSPVATQNFTPTAGANWSGAVSLGTFTRGKIQVTGYGYGIACASVTASTAPTWTADPLLRDLTPGVPLSAPLTFRQNLPVQATGNFAPSIASMSVGTYDTVLRLADGTVRTVTGPTGIQQPTGLTNVAEVATGSDHACARKNDGTVWCWGGNNFGQLGNGTTTHSFTTPVQVTGLTNVLHIAAGAVTSCAGTATNTYCWGANGYGALGDGSTTNRSSPVNIGGRTRKVAITETHSCYADSGGAVRCSGSNLYGELGNGTTTSSLSFVGIGGGGFVDVAVGYSHSCAINAAGHVYCWGRNAEGQLGNGTTTNSSVAVRVTAVDDWGVEIRAGVAHTCLRHNDGHVSCWGENTSFQLGDGTGQNSSLPVFTVNEVTTAIGATSYGACALLATGGVSCWGDMLGGPRRFTPTLLSL